ncbi:putative Glycerophosphoryl diester phosphodiesterase [Zostera marina]|uniref:glycerophosphodiester phosphodiesterase n=1 Tax=Zostera marina TaxID=29655 RepID=A0A0K9PFD9_ZOSMR|nr:putative Glycerophosphoryl diester phosphodiesterase [Zostera marina]
MLIVLTLIQCFGFRFHLKRRLINQQRARECEWLQNPPFLCAHGGDSDKAFPNMMEAYYYALQLNVNCIEIDISRSSDGVLFAIHDRELQKITENNTAKFGYFSKNEVEELDARYQQPIKIEKQRVPTLEDALTLISQSVGLVILDAKFGPPLYEKSLAEDIILVVEKTNCRNCVILSKSDNLLSKINKLKQDFPVGYVVQKDLSTRVRSKLLRMEGADFVSVYHPLINEKLVKTIHEGSKKVYAWTVDDESSMYRLLRQNIEVIITGKPAVLQGIMLKIQRECGKDLLGFVTGMHALPQKKGYKKY